MALLLGASVVSCQLLQDDKRRTGLKDGAGRLGLSDLKAHPLRFPLPPSHDFLPVPLARDLIFPLCKLFSALDTVITEFCSLLCFIICVILLLGLKKPRYLKDNCN